MATPSTSLIHRLYAYGIWYTQHTVRHWGSFTVKRLPLVCSRCWAMIFVKWFEITTALLTQWQWTKHINVALLFRWLTRRTDSLPDVGHDGHELFIWVWRIWRTSEKTLNLVSPSAQVKARWCGRGIECGHCASNCNLRSRFGPCRS